MKELMKTNVYDVGESVLIVGSCLRTWSREGFAQLCASSGHVFELCLEQTHINMAITEDQRHALHRQDPHAAALRQSTARRTACRCTTSRTSCGG